MPAAAPAAARRANAAAMAVLYQELSRLAPGVFGSFRRTLSADAADEAVALVAMALARTGPRRGSHNPPATPARVRAFLRRALKNRAIDFKRRADRQRKHETTLDRGPDEAGPSHEHLADPGAMDAEARVVARQTSAARQAQIDVANQRIDARIAAMVSHHEDRRRGVGTRLAETLTLLSRAAAGEVNVDDVVAQQCGPGAAAAVIKKERNAYDVRFGRARRKVDDWLSAAMTRPDLLEPDSVEPANPELIRFLVQRRFSLKPPVR